MSEDLNDEELADLRRQQAAREEQRQLDAYEEERFVRWTAELSREEHAEAQLLEELVEQEQKGQGA